MPGALCAPSALTCAKAAHAGHGDPWHVEGRGHARKGLFLVPNAAQVDRFEREQVPVCLRRAGRLCGGGGHAEAYRWATIGTGLLLPLVPLIIIASANRLPVAFSVGSSQRLARGSAWVTSQMHEGYAYDGPCFCGHALHASDRFLLLGPIMLCHARTHTITVATGGWCCTLQLDVRAASHSACAFVVLLRVGVLLGAGTVFCLSPLCLWYGCECVSH